jgi:hypothetical protein
VPGLCDDDPDQGDTLSALHECTVASCRALAL